MAGREAQAATQIQAAHRGRATRRQQEQAEQAAVRIQSVIRGQQARAKREGEHGKPHVRELEVGRTFHVSGLRGRVQLAEDQTVVQMATQQALAQIFSQFGDVERATPRVHFPTDQDKPSIQAPTVSEPDGYEFNEEAGQSHVHGTWALVTMTHHIAAARVINASPITVQAIEGATTLIVKGFDAASAAHSSGAMKLTIEDHVWTGTHAGSRENRTLAELLLPLERDGLVENLYEYLRCRSADPKLARSTKAQRAAQHEIDLRVGDHEAIKPHVDGSWSLRPKTGSNRLWTRPEAHFGTPTERQYAAAEGNVEQQRFKGFRVPDTVMIRNGLVYRW